MRKPDYRGARGATASYYFQELWALHHALELLDPDTELGAVTVEGLGEKDEMGTAPDTWDGVDVALFYGGQEVAEANRIVVRQMKYSSADAQSPWTAARLAYSSSPRTNNSVLRALAKPYKQLAATRGDLAADGRIHVQLVSNQPIDPRVVAALGAEEGALSEDRDALQRASGFPDSGFALFAKALDFSACGQASRLALEEHIATVVSQWTDEDARARVDELAGFIRRKMLPEAKGELITQASILAALGFASREALFPCPSTIRKPPHLIHRAAANDLLDRMVQGSQRLCVHGGAGCGKTTVLQELEVLLPVYSALITYDCYGGGGYLHSDSFRHRSRDAFLQLANDVARTLRVPLLLSKSPSQDYPRAFAKRLRHAADVVAARSGAALLVIAVDAADNGIFAANEYSPSDPGFVREFLQLGDPPENVRILVTARTGRLDELNLPRSFTQVELSGFGREETSAHLRSWGIEASDAWLDDFHHLSGRNPRVQAYVLERAKDDLGKALEHLRPDGKALTQIFDEQLEHAFRKVGDRGEIRSFCAGLIALPRPVPVGDLAAVTKLSQAHVVDICGDLAPGIRLANEAISLADEDFQDHLRAQSGELLPATFALVADHFLSRHTEDAYAARHVATALLAAGRRQELIQLVNSEPKLGAIADPLLRREVQLHRLRIGMRVCREIDNTVDAMLSLTRGAEALKTDTSIRQFLTQNPELAAHFAWDRAAREILHDPESAEHQGPLLFHRMAVDALRGDGISVREGHRQIRAWLDRRDDFAEGQKRRARFPDPDLWKLTRQDIRAETEALLRILGPREAVANLRRWKPSWMRLDIATELAMRLIAAGDIALVRRCLTEGEIAAPWDLFLLVPLALAGEEVDLTCLANDIAAVDRRRFVRPEVLLQGWGEQQPAAGRLDMILTACEVLIARGGDRAMAAHLLERFADPAIRLSHRLNGSETSLIDLSLRAHALLERFTSREATIASYLPNLPDEPVESSPQEKARLDRRAREKRDELRRYVEPWVQLYDIRAQALTGLIPPDELDAALRSSIERLQGSRYRFLESRPWSDMRPRAALSVARLIHLRDVPGQVFMEHSRSVLALGSSSSGSAESVLFESLAMDRELHEELLSAVAYRAASVRGLKTSAEEKLSTLSHYAHLLIPISLADAQAVFGQAIEVAGEVDVEVVHEIGLIPSLAASAVASMSRPERRAIARDIAIVAEDAGIRLDGNDRFPWAGVADSLALLDLALAMAAVGRWEDAGVVQRGELLETMLQTSLLAHELSSSQAIALLPLINACSPALMLLIIDEAQRQNDPVKRGALYEELARDELLRFGRGERPEVNQRLCLQPAFNVSSYWIDRLVQTGWFHQLNPVPPDEAHPDAHNLNAVGPRDRNTDPLLAIDWNGKRWVSSEDIAETVGNVEAVAQANNSYISVSRVLDRMRESVALADRVEFLEALIGTDLPGGRTDEIPEAIVKAVNEWGQGPAVQEWCQERLPSAIVELFPDFARWIALGHSPLPALLQKLGVDNDEIATLLLTALERHVQDLDAASVLALVGLMGKYAQSSDVACVLSRYSKRLASRVEPADRATWESSDIPMGPSEGIARLLYALMGDVDLRIRWRAAHAARRLARLSESETLGTLVRQYERT